VPEFDAVFAAEGSEVTAAGAGPQRLRRAPAAKQECLGRFVVSGEGHLRHLASGYAGSGSRQRPHQAAGNKPPAGASPGEAGGVACEEPPGGLLRRYRRAA
jgi:hypothetical protein